jgi:transcriptional regulator with XRE-family HTH domain
MAHAEELALEFVEQKELGGNPRIEKYLERLPSEFDRKAFLRVLKAMEILEGIVEATKPDPMFVSQLKSDLLNRLAQTKQGVAQTQGTLGSTVREARKRLKFSISDAAKRLGLSEDAFSNLESDYLARSQIADSLTSAAARLFALPADLLRRLRDALPSQLPQSMGRSGRYALARRKDPTLPQHPLKEWTGEGNAEKPETERDIFELLKDSTGKET